MNQPIMHRKSGRLRFAVAAMAAGFLLSSVLPSVALADPPDWAPAHGWRKKQKKKDYEHPVYVVQPYPYYVKPQPYPVPYGIDLGRCNRDAIGAATAGGAGRA